MTGHYRQRPALKVDEPRPGGSNIDQPLGQREAHTKINMTFDTLPLLGRAPPKPNKIWAAFYASPKPNKIWAAFYATMGALNFILLCHAIRMFIILPSPGDINPPIFHLDSLSMNVSRIPSFNVTSSNNNAVIIRWNVSFVFRNHYKYQKIIHDPAINVSVFYKKVNLSTAIISPFYQYELGEDQRSLEEAALFMANDDIFAGDWSKNGALVNVTVSIDDAVSLISPPFTYFPINFVSRFTCEDVTIIFSSDNTTGGTSMLSNHSKQGTSMLSNHSKQCKILYSKKRVYNIFPLSIWYKPSFPRMSGHDFV